MYGSTFSLTSALDEVGGLQVRFGRVREISPPIWVRTPDPPARSIVAIPTKLCRPALLYYYCLLTHLFPQGF